MDEKHKIIAETKAYNCLDCGKCTAVCSVARHDSTFSPRMLVYDAIHDSGERAIKDDRLWECLTCAACETICTSGVQYGEFIRALRFQASQAGISGRCTHGGALQSMMHIMGADQLNQNRLEWVPKKVKTASTSDTLFFVGCAPYFDTFFEDLDARTLDAPKGAIALLNRLGITPAISPNERCCGHDMLNSGDIEEFTRLASQNIKAISATGAKRVVTSCPEGYHTLKVDYPRYMGDTGFEVVHLTELLAEAVSSEQLNFKKTSKKVAYHDPCRLGRISGIYDPPRQILEAIPGLDVREMAHHHSNALCCGTQSWVNCGTINKQMQMELLGEAQATGADILLTGCPKCQIHLKCALNDIDSSGEIKLKVQDFTGFVAGALSR